jgi:hypothetical protein
MGMCTGILTSGTGCQNDRLEVTEHSRDPIQRTRVDFRQIKLCGRDAVIYGK